MPLRREDFILWPGEPMPEPEMTIRVIPGHFCSECHDEIKMQIFRGTGVCSELCRKLHDGEITHDEWDERRKQRVQGV